MLGWAVCSVELAVGAILIREVTITHAIREERCYGCSYLGEEGGLKGRESQAGISGVYFNRQGEGMEIDLIFLMKFLHIGWEMTGY